MIMNGREKSIRQHKKMYKVIKKMICSVHLNENMPIFFAGTNKVHTNVNLQQMKSWKGTVRQQQ